MTAKDKLALQPVARGPSEKALGKRKAKSVTPSETSSSITPGWFNEDSSDDDSSESDFGEKDDGPWAGRDFLQLTGESPQPSLPVSALRATAQSTPAKESFHTRQRLYPMTIGYRTWRNSPWLGTS